MSDYLFRDPTVIKIIQFELLLGTFRQFSNLEDYAERLLLMSSPDERESILNALLAEFQEFYKPERPKIHFSVN